VAAAELDMWTAQCAEILILLPVHKKTEIPPDKTNFLAIMLMLDKGD
jgi:hypothetical protein